MELITYILYVLASRNILLLVVSIFLTIGGFSFVSIFVTAAIKSRPPVGERRSLIGTVLRFVVPAVLIGGFAVILGILALSIVNLVRPHLIDGMLIDAIGNKTDAKVINVEATNNRLNNNRVMRHHVIYKTAEGKNIETWFETWDFNVYPSANTVTYPGQGQSFRVAYLPNFPTAFMILTEEDSDYSRGRECGRLIAELAEAKAKADFDPTDKNYQKAVEDATKKVLAAKCGTTSTEIKTTETRELPARTQ